MAEGRDFACFPTRMCFLCNKFAVPSGLFRHQSNVSNRLTPSMTISLHEAWAVLRASFKMDRREVAAFSPPKDLPGVPRLTDGW